MAMSTLQRNLVILFGTAILIVIALATATAFNAREGLTNNRLAQESRERLVLLENLVALLFEAESSLRAFAASGDPLFLEEHQLQRHELGQHLQALEQATFPNGASTAAQRLKELAIQRAAIMDDLATTRREQGLEAAAAKISSHQGKRIMDSIREVAGRLTEAELSRLDRRKEIAERHSWRLLYMLTGGAVLNLLLLSGAYVVTRRELTRSGQLMDQIQLSTGEISRINQLSSSLQSCSSREETAEVLRHFLGLLFPAQAGGLYLMRSSRNLLALAAAWGEAETPLMDPIEPPDCWALRLGRLYTLTSTESDLHCKHCQSTRQAYLCLPLMAQSDIVGMLHIQMSGSVSLADIQRRADLVATHISAALAGITLREALHQQSVRDPLTNLYNRRYLEETMERELLRARRNNSGFGIIMLDIDHFKRFNDSHGHQAGDLLLKEFAQYLRSQVRGEDIACRYGGEEFLLVLPGATLEQTRLRAEALRKNMITLDLDYRGQQLPTVTASLGVAAHPDHGQEWETILHLADAALYHAKHSGRNQVAVAEEPGSG